MRVTFSALLLCMAYWLQMISCMPFFGNEQPFITFQSQNRIAGRRFCPDTTGDNTVDVEEIADLLSAWGSRFSPRDPYYRSKSDLNADSNINIEDLANMLGAWRCRVVAPTCPDGVPMMDASECEEEQVCRRGCPALPSARCIVDRCGGCRARFVNGAGADVDCFDFACPEGVPVGACAGPPCDRPAAEQCPGLARVQLARCLEDFCGGCAARYVDLQDDTPVDCRCADGSPLVACDADPCEAAQCPGHPRARCTADHCGGCRAVWRVEGRRVQCSAATDSCPLGRPLARCFADPCDVNTCPRYPNARCVANYCGGCNAEFYDADSGHLIDDCALPDDPDPECQEGDFRNDGCNTCVCRHQRWVCTLRACPPEDPQPECDPSSCAIRYREMRGPSCPDGSMPDFKCINSRCQSFCRQCRENTVRYDECNKCTCRGGSWLCTEIACEDPSKPGMCPEVTAAVVCPNESRCRADSACEGDKKCCNNCCHDPVPCDPQTCERSWPTDELCSDGSAPKFSCLDGKCQRECAAECPNGTPLCFRAPCDGATSCAAFPEATCRPKACSCDEEWFLGDRKVDCTLRCFDGATRYDGCNSCHCQDGRWHCTEMFCEPPDSPCSEVECAQSPPVTRGGCGLADGDDAVFTRCIGGRCNRICAPACPLGGPPLERCLRDPCEGASCPRHPSAACQTQRCAASCTALWSVRGQRVQCSDDADDDDADDDRVACGDVMCPQGLVCCNPLCGICARPDEACIQGCPVAEEQLSTHQSN